MAPPPDLCAIISDAVRYWEPRRIAYNLVLGAVVAGWVALTWPHFRAAITRPSLRALSVLAVLANLCYCAAYLVDILAQYTMFRESWRRQRLALWVLGTLFAGVVADYWIADEIYPSVV